MANGLTNKQQAFINEYLKCWNATEAARRAEYKHPNVQGPTLVNLSNIKAEIDRRIAENAMTADEVLARLAEHARGDLSPFIKQKEDDTTAIDLTSEEAQKKIHLVKKVRQTKKRGSTRSGDMWEEEFMEIEIHDPQAALVHLGRHHKLFVDRQEITGKDGNNLIIEYVNNWKGAGDDE